MKQRVKVIVGATSSIAAHVARLWIEESSFILVLVGRHADKLARMAQDLKARNPAIQVHTKVTSFLDPDAIQQTVNTVAMLGVLDTVLIAQGLLPDQHKCQTDLQACREAIDVNALSPVLFAEAFAGHLAQQSSGTLAIIGSVAGDRGRKSNYIYGAAKGLITRYTQGLQHRFAKTPIKIILINPGPTHTPMTAHLENAGMRLAPVTLVAKQIVKAIQKGDRVVYTPKLWRWVMCVIRMMPTPIFHRLEL